MDVIKVPSTPNLSAEAGFGLRVLIDLSRLLQVQDLHADVVGVEIEPGLIGWPTSAHPGISHRDGAVILSAKLLETVARVVTAARERLSPGQLDRYGRVVAAANELVERGVSNVPVVNGWAIELHDRVAAAAGRRPFFALPAWPAGHAWAVGMTHDVDVVAGWPVFLALRLIELIRKGKLALAGQALGAGFKAALRSPVIEGVGGVLAVERDAEIRATWFFLAGEPSVRSWTRGDVTYSIDGQRARRLLDAVLADGHEIGLHGSLLTSAAPGRFASERDRLAAMIRAPVQGVRQHFLAIRPGVTHLEMANTGFRYDATMGFFDRSGFRLGVADIVPARHLEATSGENLELVPLIWMDRAASKYAGDERPSAWVEEAVARAETCRKVGGLFTALWHPNLTAALGFPGAPPVFAKLSAHLRAGSPWFAPLHEIVAWRRARRAVLARSITGGQPEVSWRRSPFADRLTLVDASGRPVVDCPE